jgi:hypothetical protein
MRLISEFSWTRSPVHSVSKVRCAPFFLGLAIGMKYALRRRLSMMSFVIPSSSKRK